VCSGKAYHLHFFATGCKQRTVVFGLALSVTLPLTESSSMMDIALIKQEVKVI